MPDKKEFIIFILLCLVAYGLGYWYGMPGEDSDERAEASTPPAPTVVTNITTNIVAATPQPTPTPTPVKPRPTPPPVKPRPQPALTNIVPATQADEKGFKSIFNGKDLTGWTGPIQNYQAVDGTLRCKPGKGGTIYTKEVYGDFVVRLESSCLRAATMA